jgi:YfiR/HmsC-like
MKSSRLRTPPTVSLVLAALLLAYGSFGGELPPGKQAIFLARVIAYDGNLKGRAGPAVNIAVLAKKGDKDSEAMAEAILKAFSPLASATLSGLPVNVIRIPFAGREALEHAVREGGIDTLYVCSGLDAALADIKNVSRQNKVLTVASQEGHLKLGLSLGVFDIGGKNTILVNLDASREEGVAFGPELLRLATVVR